MNTKWDLYLKTLKSPKNTRTPEHHRYGDRWRTTFAPLFSDWFSNVFTFSALEQSLRMFWSSSSSLMFMVFASKCRRCHNTLSDQMLAFLPDAILQRHWTNTDLIRMISNTSSKNININLTKPCLILVLFCYFFLSIFFFKSHLKALLAVLIPLWHDADTMYSVVLVWRQCTWDAVCIKVLVSL